MENKILTFYWLMNNIDYAEHNCNFDNKYKYWKYKILTKISSQLVALHYIPFLLKSNKYASRDKYIIHNFVF